MAENSYAQLLDDYEDGIEVIEGETFDEYQKRMGGIDYNAYGGLTGMGYANGGGIGSMMKPKKKRVNFRGGGMDMGNASNQAQSAASSGRGSRSSNNNNNNNNGGGNNDYNYRGPADLGVTTRAVNRVTAPSVDRSAVGQFSNYGQNVMSQNLGKNNPTKSGIFSGGFNPLALFASLLGGPLAGLAMRGIMGLKGGFKGLAGKMRGINQETGEPNTQQQYEDARYDRQQVGRLDKLFAAKDKGYNTLTPFGLFNDKFKTTNFTEGQQSKIDQLMAQGYMPSTARNVNSGRGSGLRDTLASQSMPQVNITGLNNNDFNGVQNVDRSITSGQIDEFQNQLGGMNNNDYDIGNPGGMVQPNDYEMGDPSQYATADMINEFQNQLGGMNNNDFGVGNPGSFATADMIDEFGNGRLAGNSNEGFVNDPYATSDQGNLLGVPGDANQGFVNDPYGSSDDFINVESIINNGTPLTKSQEFYGSGVRPDFYPGDRLNEIEMENGVVTNNTNRLVAPFRLANGGIISLRKS